MEYFSLSDIVLLCLFALLAGFIDSIVGGGGLITIPAFMILVPQLPVPTMFGTNKVAAMLGTSVSAYRYSKEVKLDWKVLWIGLITTLAFAFVGAWLISYLDKELVKPMVLVLLISVAVYTFVKKKFGIEHKHTLSPSRARLYAALFGMVIGFYDGFFGPGTGSFLIFFFVGVFGYDFLHASAAAKLLNIAANLSAVIYFACTGHIILEIALIVAVFNMTGAWIGTRTAIKQGSAFVRILFLVVVVALILKLGWDVILK